MQRREKGTGTIFQRECGTWSGRVSIGRGSDGKTKYKYFSGKTEAEVKRKIREYNKSGPPTSPQQILLKDYLMNWLVRGDMNTGCFPLLHNTYVKPYLYGKCRKQSLFGMNTEFRCNIPTNVLI